jgi:hypothetical protein
MAWLALLGTLAVDAELGRLRFQPAETDPGVEIELI